MVVLELDEADAPLGHQRLCPADDIEVEPLDVGLDEVDDLDLLVRKNIRQGGHGDVETGRLPSGNHRFGEQVLDTGDSGGRVERSPTGRVRDRLRADRYPLARRDRLQAALE